MNSCSYIVRTNMCVVCVYTQEARIPLMLMDSLVIYGLTVWEKRLKDDKAKRIEKEGLQKEVDKKAARAAKAAIRQEQKEGVKKAQNHGQAFPHTVHPSKRHGIVQPDKTKGN
jgi:hypothetical protein